jgi:hypothetical protein
LTRWRRRPPDDMRRICVESSCLCIRENMCHRYLHNSKRITSFFSLECLSYFGYLRLNFFRIRFDGLGGLKKKLQSELKKICW